MVHRLFWSFFRVKCFCFSQEGNTPLALAVRKEDHDIAELLLKEGKADPNAQVKVCAKMPEAYLNI